MANGEKKCTVTAFSNDHQYKPRRGCVYIMTDMTEAQVETLKAREAAESSEACGASRCPMTRTRNASPQRPSARCWPRGRPPRDPAAGPPVRPRPRLLVDCCSDTSRSPGISRASRICAASGERRADPVFSRIPISDEGAP